jgi:phosphoglucosamine mutase
VVPLVAAAPAATRKLFGTDGVRGVAGEFLTAELALALARAATARVQRDDPARVLVIRDTRESGEMLEAAVAAGIAAAGGEALLGGVLPTPGAPLLIGRYGFDLAAVLSASHNPYRDNGIKFFGGDGYKLSDATEAGIEAALEQPHAVPEHPGRVRTFHGALEDYLRALGERFADLDLTGQRILLDCANGSTFRAAPEIFRRLGADIGVLAHEPDGRNINAECGSTHPAHLQAEVRRLGADVGLAFDGDADRVVAVDEAGELVDGDQIVAICAIDRKARHRLTDDAVVVTVMTNLGFRLAMRQHGIEVVETAVGDRHVLEALERRSLSLGGEQSGHVIFRDLATTGDGLLTGVQLLDVVRRTGRPLGALAGAAMERLPQVLHNVRIERRVPDLDRLLSPAIASVEADLGERGRVLVRPSGTEPVVRVMVEAGTRAAAEEAAAKLAAEVGRVTRSAAGA